jgi:hypothetical protein
MPSLQNSSTRPSKAIAAQRTAPLPRRAFLSRLEVVIVENHVVTGSLRSKQIATRIIPSSESLGTSMRGGRPRSAGRDNSNYAARDWLNVYASARNIAKALLYSVSGILPLQASIDFNQ